MGHVPILLEKERKKCLKGQVNLNKIERELQFNNFKQRERTLNKRKCLISRKVISREHHERTWHALQPVILTLVLLYAAFLSKIIYSISFSSTTT
jgi:hypothetical protein